MKVILALVVLLAMGCLSTSASLIQARAEGTSQDFPVSPESARQIARAVLDGTGFIFVEDRGNLILATTETIAPPWSLTIPTRIAIWIEPAAAGTRVTVLSRSLRAGNPFPREMSESEFLAGFAAKLRGD